MHTRSSVKWTALTGVTPGTMGSSVKRRAPAGPTVAMNVCVAAPLEPPASVAVTVTVAVPSPVGVTVTVLPRTATAATAGAEEAAP